MNMPYDDLFRTIDRMDADGFVRFLTEDARFRFGNMPAIVGRQAIRDAVSAFFASITDLSHRVTGIYEQGNTAIVEGEVTYTRKDGSRVTLPFANFFTLSPSPLNSAESAANDSPTLICDYRIYIDLSPLYSSG